MSCQYLQLQTGGSCKHPTFGCVFLETSLCWPSTARTGTVMHDNHIFESKYRIYGMSRCYFGNGYSAGVRDKGELPIPHPPGAAGRRAGAEQIRDGGARLTLDMTPA
ncbi:hypothetical protein J3459_011877 [Metarhizium acridum]|uniref:uncharacterized protein n=1 Tax=Metarhizium acridum TaxID=92637 RepID=UPI001C6B0675|nr:hypothetical protein J3458_009599 [Metarhizium acridum]KAG8418961.1 hypothetical protein J3459_011877 [Metarhizium acridum]